MALDAGATLVLNQASLSANMSHRAASSSLVTGSAPLHKQPHPAFQIPGHAIFLANPNRLSVLSVNIDATTTIVTSRAAPLAALQDSAPTLQSLLLNQAASPHPQSLQPPSSNTQHNTFPSKFRSPFPPTASSAYRASASKSSRSRPLSQELGQRARDAINEFGRIATRRTSAMERSNGADTLAQVADGLDTASPNLQSLCRATVQPWLPQHNAPQPSAARVDMSPGLHLASDDAVVLSSSCTHRLSLVPQPQSLQASQTLPFDIQSRTISSDTAGPASAAVEFISDSPATAASASFDPSRLLLKVRPPAELAREAWSRSTTFLTAHKASEYDTTEHHAINLCFHLRLAGTTTTPTSTCFPRGQSTASEPQASDADPTRQILFLSASSPEKLAEAIDSPQSLIATAELASLEGIIRVPVKTSNSAASPAVFRGPSDCDFEWPWKSLSRSSTAQATRCCCAFVELYADGWKASLLSAFSFHVELPDPSTGPTDMALLNQASSAARGAMSRTDSLALIAALNFGTHVSPLTESKPLPTSSPNHITADLSRGSDSPPQDIASAPLSIDRTELALQDIANDSPIFRAAIVNLERRTANLKKLSKNMLKTAQEVRLRILKLAEAEHAMDAACQDLAAIAPETLGTLQDNHMRQARERISQHRGEQVLMIETYLERPLSQTAELCRVALESFKLFDNESKSYYSQTQKWLANRSEAPTAENGQALASSAVASDKAQKNERADEKQKLRELRFEQARLDLFAMMQRLHGSKAEAHLAQCFLQLSRWLVDLPNTLMGPAWSAPAHKSSLSTFGIGLQATLDVHAAQLAQVEARSRQLSDRIRTLEQALGKFGETDVDIIGAQRFNAEQETPQSAHSNGAVSAKARKFRSFLGSFAAGINNSPRTPNNRVPGPRQAELQKQADVANGHDRPQKADARRRLSLKLKSEAIQRPDRAPSLPSPALSPFNWAVSDAPATPRRGTELMPGELSEHLTSSWHGASDHARTASDVGSSATGHDVEPKHADRGLGIFAPSSPKIARAADREVVPTASAGMSAPSILPGGERKKEGVLWVMSKPVTGPAGADAPRGVNRSAHWRECWVVLSGSGQISEFADWKNAKALEPSNPLIDLRFATVREARGVDRRFAFEVVTRDNRRFFQAQDEETMRDWMRAISKAIESLLNGTSSVRKLDRAVRGSPFRNLDSAQRAGTLDENEEEPGAGEGNDFAVRRLLDRSSKALSQSMTDLSATAKAQAGERKDQGKLGGHLVMMSEGHGDSSSGSSKRKSRHQRGISNKTPISGYLAGGAGGAGLSAAGAAGLHRQDSTRHSEEGSTSSLSGHGEHDIEFDRQIEANVHRKYGSYDEYATSHSGISNTSGHTGVDEMGLLKGNPNLAAKTSSASPSKGSSGISSRQRSAVNGSATTSTSIKMSRAAEIAAISRLPENQWCADCRESDPRWASWMLANEPCCIFICIGCSGVHRSLGVHISKVKSVDLDDWTEEQLQSARDWGNVRANALWEHSKPAGLLPTVGDRKDFWRIKYVEQQWKAPAVVVQEPSAMGSRASVKALSADEDDVDATPTRRIVQPASTAVATASPERMAQAKAKNNGLRINPTATPGRTTEGLGSPRPHGPRPHGPRPLPTRRSVSMHTVPTSSPPLSPLSSERTQSIDSGLRSPASALRPSMDWISNQAVTRPSCEEDAAARDLPHLPVSSSVPHLAAANNNAAMLAARADPRLFPNSNANRTTAHASGEKAGKALQVSSPPSSFFVANLDGRTPSPSPMPSPMIFDSLKRSGDMSWDIHSGYLSSAAAGEDDVRAPSQPPARFEAFNQD